MATDPAQPVSVTDLLGRSKNRYIFLIGGGGKTTLMFALANSLCRDGQKVITTTSTKILYPSPETSPVIEIEENIDRLTPRVREQLRERPHVTVVSYHLAEEGKLCGFLAPELDRLHQARMADYIIVEADGAAGRSLKAHADYEPVVSHQADLVIAVVGIDCVGKPLTDEHVHRRRRYSQLLDRPEGTPITTEDIATLFFHPQGYMKAVGPQSEVTVFLSKVKTPADRTNAETLAEALRNHDTTARITRIAVGDLVGPAPFLNVLDDKQR